MELKRKPKRKPKWRHFAELMIREIAVTHGPLLELGRPCIPKPPPARRLPWAWQLVAVVRTWPRRPSDPTRAIFYWERARLKRVRRVKR